MSFTIDKGILGLVGVAFGLRVFDSSKSIPIRAGYGLVAWDLVSAAMNGDTATDLEPASVGALTVQERGLTPLNFVPHTVRTIEERVDLIHRQMLHGVKDPSIYALARKTLVENNVPAKDSRAEIEAMFWLVKNRVRYTWDPLDYDAFQTPRKTLELKTGDCDDGVSLLGALLRSIGHKVRTRVVHTKGFDTWNHIYLLALLPDENRWMPLDFTVDQSPGWEVPSSAMLAKPRDFDVVG